MTEPYIIIKAVKKAQEKSKFSEPDICDGSLVGNEKNGGVSVSGRNDAGLKGKGIGEA